MNFDNKKYIGIINNAFKIYSCVDTLNTKNDLLNTNVLYIILNKINNKKYVGITCISDRPFRRFRGHYTCFYKKENLPLYNAMNKYGINNFALYIIDTATNIDILNQKEIDCIKNNETHISQNGYNIELGGNCSLLSNYTKNKMSLVRRGKKQTKEWIENRIPKKGSVEALKHGRPKTEKEKEYLRKNSTKYWLGKERDKKTKNKISKTKLESGASQKQIDAYYKTVLVIDPKTKEIIDEQISTSEASKKYGINQSTVSRRCNGIVKNSGDQYFIYKSDYDKGNTDILYPENHVSERKIIQIEGWEEQKRLRLENEKQSKLNKEPKKPITQSDEWIQKRIDSVANKVIYLDRVNNKILEQYDSLANVGKENPRNDSEQRIGRICRGEISEANNNIIYCYLDDYNNGKLPKFVPSELRKFSELSDKELNDALVKYNNKQSIRSIADKLNTHFGNINSYLKDKTNTVEKFPYDDYDSLKCNKTGRIIDDVHNKSGGVLKHLKTIYPDLVVESNYKRKQIEKETGKYWYHDYFEFN